MCCLVSEGRARDSLGVLKELMAPLTMLYRHIMYTQPSGLQTYIAASKGELHGSH